MQPLTCHPAAAYRRVALEARIAAAGAGDLTRICLEEAEAALGTALALLARAEGADGGAPCRGSAAALPLRAPLSRAQTILLWLARSVAPEHPLAASLAAFYGALAAQIGASLQQPDGPRLAEIRKDIRDLLEAAG